VTRDTTVLIEFSPSGGLFQYATQLGEALATRGDRVELWTGPDPELASVQPTFTIRSVLPTWHPADGAPLPRPLHVMRRGVRAAQLVLGWVLLGIRLRRNPPRAVLFSQWRFTFEPLFVLVIRALLPGTVFGIVAHEPLPRSDAKDTSTPKSGRLLQSAFGAAWRRMDVAFVLGPQTREIVLEHWRPRCEVVVIPHGDAHALREGGPRPVADTAPVALFFGTWTSYKGIDVLLTAFALLRAEIADAELVLAGAVGADVDLEHILERARHIGNVQALPGYQPLSAVPALVESARLVVVPYIRASQSGVAHLAFTFARPVVATTVGDLPAAIHDGETGLLVAPGDPHALAAAMAKLLHDPGLAAAMGAAGRRAVSDAWAVAADRVGDALATASQRVATHRPAEEA
jgi:glycosyltransferase involved in cell wall biosynthesis